MRRLPTLVLAATPLAAWACSHDTAESGDVAGTDGGGTTTSGAETTTDTDADADDGVVDTSTAESSTGAQTSADTGESTAADETGEPPPTEPPPARGVQIVDVTADQGIRVPIAIAGELVEGPQRNLPLFQSRPALIRAFYALDPGFVDRDIYAVLTLEHGDATTSTYEAFTTVFDGECEPAWDCRYVSLTGSFNFKISAEDMRPGTSYRIELFETAPGHENDPSDKIPVFPTQGGSMEIGIEDSYMKMRVVVVPFYHDEGADCPEAPDMNAGIYEGNTVTHAELFRERLLAHNPADEVEIMVHSVVNWGGSVTQGGALLNRLQELRYQDNAPPEYYYYGVIRPCGEGPSFSGIAQLGGPSQSDASQRVGWGVFYNNAGSTAGTFVHEIGHEQGRAHIACTGEEAGPDTSYPDHPQGDTESYGTDVIASQLKVHPPSSHDYMTYCGSTWVSEWGYDKVIPWIEEISSWELGGPDGGEKRPLLFGFLGADGTTRWFVADDYWDPAAVDPDVRIDWRAGGRVVASEGARVIRYTDSDDWHVIAPAPADLAGVTSLALQQGEVRRIVDVGEVRRIAHGTSLGR